jgi:hypothetical protein
LIIVRRGLRQKDKSRRDEPIQVVMHTYMGMCKSPWIAILNKQKCRLFFFNKIREQEGGTGLV